MRATRWLRAVAVLAVAVLLAAAPCFAQGLEWVKAHYTKQEFYVPMRDGVRLFTAVYLPKDRSQKYPIMLRRTPYSIAPYGADNSVENLGPSPVFATEGYVFVYQDVRGRWMSEGEFEHVRPHKDVKNGPRDIDESTDTYDTIEWLLKNLSDHNGRVGMYGISYPGFYVAAGMIDAHPALKAASPQAPVADWFSADDWHHNGAFLLAHAFGWFSRNGCTFTAPTTVSPCPPFDLGTEDGYDFYLRLGPLRNANEKYLKGAMPFWNEMMKRDAKDAWWNARNLRPHLKNIKPAVMTVGGWFDAENLFGALEVYRAVEKQNSGAANILVMGPWVHGGWSRNDGATLGDARFDAKTAEFYREHIELAFFNFYLMVDDQRHAARRPDVLVYVSDVLADDVTVAGPITPSLHVSTTGTDQDFIVKLIDVYPDRFPDEKGGVENTLGGYQQLVRGEVMRGKFRNSLEKPEPFVPGKVTKVEWEVSDTLHTFRRGHRIMIQIQSTWFPLVDINPGKFMNIYEATDADFQKTTQRVFRSRSMPSQIRIGVLPSSSLWP